jgi:hypothetical protein
LIARRIYMKKIAFVCVCLLFVSVSMTAAAPTLKQHTQRFTVDPTGTFEGYLGVPEHQGHNETVVGIMNGTYWLRNRGGRFTATWETENRTGALRGGFGRHLLIGRISTMVNGTQRSLPIIGFLKAQDNEFIGRFMSYIGPALYFWGTYT